MIDTVVRRLLLRDCEFKDFLGCFVFLVDEEEEGTERSCGVGNEWWWEDGDEVVGEGGGGEGE